MSKHKLDLQFERVQRQFEQNREKLLSYLDWFKYDTDSREHFNEECLAAGGSIQLYSLFRECLCKSKKKRDIKPLLASCNVNQIAFNGTVLQYAAELGLGAVVRLLLDSGADPNILNPLYGAAYYSHATIVKMLIEAGANINEPNQANGETSLHRAILNGNATIVEMLIKAGAAIDVKTEYSYSCVDTRDIRIGNTPLFYAIENDDHYVENLLINAGADIYATNKNEYTLLHQAIYYRNEVMIRFLIENWDLEVCAKTLAGDTPLHLAVFHQQNDDTVKYLLDYKADVNAVNAGGYTPLHIAAQQGYGDTIELLLEYGADKNKVTKNGERSLDFAKRHIHLSSRIVAVLQ